MQRKGDPFVRLIVVEESADPFDGHGKPPPTWRVYVADLAHRFGKSTWEPRGACLGSGPTEAEARAAAVERLKAWIVSLERGA